MHRLATVHARDNQPTTNDVTTQPISISVLSGPVTLHPLSGNILSKCSFYSHVIFDGKFHCDNNSSTFMDGHFLYCCQQRIFNKQTDYSDTQNQRFRRYIDVAGAWKKHNCVVFAIWARMFISQSNWTPRLGALSDCVLADNNTSVRWEKCYGLQWRRWA